MNSEVDKDHFDTHIYPFIFRKVAPGLYWTNRKQPADHQLIGHFRKKSLFFRDTRDHQEHDTKNRLSIPGPSPEKLMAEIDELKKNDLRVLIEEIESAISNLFETRYTLHIH